MYDLIQMRRGTTAQWASKNPILAAGEIGVELGALNTEKFKIGNGTNRWADLPYFKNATELVTSGPPGSEGPAGPAGADGAPGPAGADGNSSGMFSITDHYGFVAMSGDPMEFTTNGSFGPNTLFITRLFVPHSKILTGLRCLVNAAGTHDGTGVENKMGLWDDSGVLIGQLSDNASIWTGGVGWRGGAMIDGPIAAQSTDRFVYVGILVHGVTGLNIAYRVAGDTQGVQTGPSTTKRRSILNGSPGPGLPPSFDPTSYSSITGYTPCVAIS